MSSLKQSTIYTPARKYLGVFCCFLEILLVLNYLFAALPAEASAYISPQVTQVKTETSNTVWYLDHRSHQRKAYVSEKAFLSYGNSFKQVVVVKESALYSWPEVKYVRQGQSKDIYLIVGNKKAKLNQTEICERKIDQTKVLSLGKKDFAEYKNTSLALIYGQSQKVTAKDVEQKKISYVLSDSEYEIGRLSNWGPNEDITIDRIEFYLEKNAEAPLPIGDLKLLNKKNSQTIDRVEANRAFIEGKIVFDTGKFQVAKGEKLSLVVIMDAQVEARDGDYYRAVNRRVFFTDKKGNEMSELSTESNGGEFYYVKKARASVSIKQSEDILIPAASKGFTLAELSVENPGGEAAYLDRLELAFPQEGRADVLLSSVSLNYKNLKLPMSLGLDEASLDLSTQKIIVPAGKKITLKVLVDIRDGVNAGRETLIVKSLRISDKKTALKSLAENEARGRNFQIIKPSLVSSGIKGSSVTTGRKAVQLLTFDLYNDGDEAVRVKSFDLSVFNGLLSQKSGFSKLRLLDQNSAKSFGSLSVPLANKARFTSSTLHLEAGEKKSLVLVADLSPEVKTDSLTLALGNLEYQGTESRLKRVIASVGQVQVSVDHSVETPVLKKPVSGKVSYYFNDPKYPFAGGHQGVDFTASQGSSVKSAGAGTVEQVVYNGTTDYAYIVINHGNGLETLYGHLSKVYVKVGDKVNLGQRIALSGGKPGTIGAGTQTNGPHLHFEVLKNGTNVDPLDFFAK